MDRFFKKWRNRYFEGIAWMKIDEGFASMMYIAATLSMYFIICQVIPEKTNQYAILMGVNVFLVYVYSVISNNFIKNNTVRMVQLIGFIIIEILVLLILGRGLDLWFAIGLMFIPIAVAVSMVFVQENYLFFEDFINIKNIDRFGTVVITTGIPTLTAAIPLMYMPWSIFVKILIVIAFMAIMPYVAWADSEDIGIFGAIGVEW